MQRNTRSIFSLQNCVVDQMMLDRGKLGELFQTCGQKELDFLTNSGLWFGFLLGCIQMIVSLVWSKSIGENPWSLSIGGGIVGLATNWLALKWIFQPVEPIPLLGGRLGIQLQGMFLRRQPEVAKEFSNYFATEILTPHQLWNSILTDPTTKPAFTALVTTHLKEWVTKNKVLLKTVVGDGNDESSSSFQEHILPTLTELAIQKYVHKHVSVTYDYMEKTLGLQETLKERMECMSGRQFERVLHPIFEEDETTLILAGAALGFGAGLLQQGLDTGMVSYQLLQRWVLRGICSIRDSWKRIVVGGSTSTGGTGSSISRRS
uniref:DUF445 domain-containing protein n=1 Tax=Grammatophora oceanica TaxID=210454 RepID=A0A7S1YJ88_9STRA|mmetsp:Transcript_52458/g.78379  ORF Transcript_52458/g.78379 Transcript_52458/m.78379 type:complete len:319 (+) Transcript_52458:384-1340(+)